MDSNRNILQHRLQIVAGGKKALLKLIFKNAMVLAVIVGFITASTALSTSMTSVSVSSSGEISGEISAMNLSTTYRSEIRGVFIHETIFAFPHDWNVIAETLAKYKIDSVYVHLAGTWYSRSDAEWNNAINAFHAKGIEFYACIAGPDCSTYSAETRWIDYQGNPYSLGDCPNYPAYRAAVKANVERIAAQFDIDGVLYDYLRYDVAGMCYCPLCKAKFEAWLGESIPASNWAPNQGDFSPSGSRFSAFAEYRAIPMTELARDMRNWMLAINPDLKFGLGAWSLISDSGGYISYYYGQDPADWVNKGYLDMVAPMMYVTDNALLVSCVVNDNKYYTGGPEGKVPMVPVITTGITTPFTIDMFKTQIDLLRQNGAGGFMIWRYGGAGIDDRGFHINIEPYLQAINLPDSLALDSVQVSATATEVTITWRTSLPATSRIEYSTVPLFNASYRIGANNFHYWDVDHIQGLTRQNPTLVTAHSIVLTELTPQTTYYFRVQSQGSSGTATSRVLTFSTS